MLECSVVQNMSLSPGNGAATGAQLASHCVLQKCGCSTSATELANFRPPWGSVQHSAVAVPHVSSTVY